ncbi:MAG: hypothetical protein K6C35_01130 [Eubacterium sp.]|nr:hypothetical protein [Eubacterium sp.]
MVDNEKVKIMTRIAIYEKNEEHEGLVLSKYFREDYVKYNMLKTLVTSTICFWLFVAVSTLVDFEKHITDFGKEDYIKLVGKVMMYYVIFLAVFEVLAFFAYSYRYARVKPGLVEYNGNLRKLIEYYDKLETTDTAIYKVSSSIGGDIDDLEMKLIEQKKKGEADHGRAGEGKK